MTLNAANYSLDYFGELDNESNRIFVEHARLVARIYFRT